LKVNSAIHRKIPLLAISRWSLRLTADLTTVQAIEANDKATDKGMDMDRDKPTDSNIFSWWLATSNAVVYEINIGRIPGWTD
jgi:hypothetical protein